MKRTIAILLFNNVEELDFAGPWEVFAALRNERPDLCDVYTVSETGGGVACAKGLRVVADYSFATAPSADVLIVPGGNGRRVEVTNAAVITYIRDHARRAQMTASVCTGAFLLSAAGLLDGLTVTTYWAAKDELRAANPKLMMSDSRWVDSGSIITAAGVSAGIDMSLHLVRRLWGHDVMRALQKAIEYFPRPPE